MKQVFPAGCLSRNESTRDTVPSKQQNPSAIVRQTLFLFYRIDRIAPVEASLIDA